MKKLYLVYTGGGEYEDYYETLHATFNSLEEAKEWSEENLKEIRDYSELNTLWEKFKEDHPECDEWNWDFDCSDDAPNAEELFSKEHPEYTAEDLTDMWEAQYGRADSIILIYELIPGVPAEIHQVATAYIRNPNIEDDCIPEGWRELKKEDY